MDYGNVSPFQQTLADPLPTGGGLGGMAAAPSAGVGSNFSFNTAYTQYSQYPSYRNSPDPISSIDFSPFPTSFAPAVVEGPADVGMQLQAQKQSQKASRGGKKVSTTRVVKGTIGPQQQEEQSVSETTITKTPKKSGGIFSDYWWIWLPLALLLLWWLYRRFRTPATTTSTVTPTSTSKPQPIQPPQQLQPAQPSRTQMGQMAQMAGSPTPSSTPSSQGTLVVPPSNTLVTPSPVTPQTHANTEKPYGTLTGDVTTDTSNIFTVDDIVCLQSMNSGKYLRFVQIEQSLPNEDSAPEADLVLEATGTDCLKDLSSQWRVKSPSTYKRAIRLENVGNPGEYLREFLRENPQQNLPVSGWQAGVGWYWSDLWATTRNFLAPEYTDTQNIVLIGAKVADMLKLKALDKNSQWLLAARPDGTIIRPDKALASEVAVLWRVKVIGKYMSDGKISYIS